ncbi:MAG: YwaF family protein [Candidatus Izemoplasmatales bacterium]|nr:YwaF family protein [bacterium]MDZ4195807.1 YwaF family protein [Candidatus Izemoplasmatales bacterium]
MSDFFSNELGQSLEWFGLAHILLIVGFLASIVLLWVFLPRIKNRPYEKWIRYFILLLVVLFEWNVFESRILTTSLLRMPLCAVALYSLTYAVACKKEKVFVIGYFYAFGSLLSFLFFDTPWGLDRWNGWTFFGAHAMIAWLAVYGYKVLGFTPKKKDFIRSSLYLVLFAIISGYATYRFGGSDELFLFTPPVDFLVSLQDVHVLLYLLVFSSFIAVMMGFMYLTIYFSQKQVKKLH